jgi:SAM-dependent methyltransferase
MDVELARWLVSAAAEPALAQAQAEADPDSVGAAQRLRRSLSADEAAAVLTQAKLRRKAAVKFGPASATLFFTQNALEQATRADVSAWRAARFAATGVRKVVDIGCGIGADSLAFAEAGLEVVAIEADPVTATLATANLAGRGRVLCADAVGEGDSVAPLVAAELTEGVAVFCDPARRTATGRSWKVADFSPSWDFATELLTGRFGCIKGAPGLPWSFIPDHCGVTWVSHDGDLVETSLWSDGPRQAVLLPAGEVLDAADRVPVPLGTVGRYLYEPDPAVIRSGAVGALAAELGAHAPDTGIAYLFADKFTQTEFATPFEVLESMPFDERTLRAWVRANGIGILEIKCRGIELDPAVLRRRLKPKGSAAATLVLTPCPSGARALAVHRLQS